MLVAQARVNTDRPSRYVVQLCKHFAHKVHAEWTEERGFADFGWGTCTLIAEKNALVLRAEAPDEEGLGRVQFVAGDHAERFGARDNLTVTWTREPALAPGDPGE
jgi:hypothetical protein